MASEAITFKGKAAAIAPKPITSKQFNSLTKFNKLVIKQDFPIILLTPAAFKKLSKMFEGDL